MSSVSTKCLIIGSGPAGYTAAIYAARAMLSPILLSGVQPGGQLTVTTDVSNYPGFPNTIQGPWLMEQMRDQAAYCGATIVNDIAIRADFFQPQTSISRITCESGVIYEPETLIIATGAQAKWLGLPSESKFLGFGVSSCATCDGFFFRNKKVMVVGGGNTAVEEALHLSKYATKVLLVHRRDHLRAEKTLQKLLFEQSKVEVIWNSTLHEILGRDDPLCVTGACLQDTKTGTRHEISVDGVFITIGHDPSVELFKNQVKLTPSGYIWTEPNSTRTNIPGVFAAGDVANDRFRQAVISAGMGCMAALEAEQYLTSLPTR